MAVRRIQKELVDLNKNPIEFAHAGPIDDNLFHWEGHLMGPRKSPYSGGIFRLKIEFPQEFPFKPPQVKFITKTYHPNIDDDGSVCIALLKSDVWKPASRVSDILLSLHLILETPNPDDALQGTIAEQYKTDFSKFEKTAKEWTKKYASA
ncbi:putative ubiquitin-conjugating enzyme e2-16 kda [Polychytrium aggregatum]|uniref:putative ubiquitin-conjugating enzyme e2-16 kda n=1 Tax=Polychytrium aggregatum TaxID=110093 RepID=UPI0022FF34A2|nr:putative ubiquitin-conjugating enzyme e2-16 kda [Polychytrium aggregatum]KAI9208638.1 putative ubiquitin-conjugating enzyme e2-16 kda [Polychytrium aggregatum]